MLTSNEYARRYRERHPERWREIQRSWRERNRAAETERKRRWREANPTLVKLLSKAHRAVRIALNSGNLTKPGSCDECNTVVRRITAAHEDYEPPYLNIRWLCYSCHSKWDMVEPKSREIE